MALKTDRNELDKTVLPDGQHTDYLVLSPDEIARGFVRPIRTQYRHTRCGTNTSMPYDIAATYATNPSFYGSTFCASCGGHFIVGPDGEFIWEDGSKVGT